MIKMDGIQAMQSNICLNAAIWNWRLLTNKEGALVLNSALYVDEWSGMQICEHVGNSLSL